MLPNHRRDSADTQMNLVRRAYTVPALHRPLPWRVALATVRVRAARLWRDPALRAYAHQSMSYLLEGRADTAEIDRAAKAWVFETVKRDELTWRPWQTTRFPVEGSEVMHAAVAGGRGAILSFFHHGQYGGVFGSLARYGIRSHCAVLPMFFDDPIPGYEGARDVRHMKTVTAGAQIFPAKDCFGHMADLLAGGEIVAIASDLPGSLPMTILGRRVSAASGAARLSLETGAPIIAITARRHPRGQTLVLGEPIDPHEHVDVASIQQAIADAHAPALRAWPEALMEPLERWRVLDGELVEQS